MASQTVAEIGSTPRKRKSTQGRSVYVPAPLLPMVLELIDFYYEEGNRLGGGIFPQTQNMARKILQKLRNAA